jgi:SAM-dependent methyltransferase
MLAKQIGPVLENTGERVIPDEENNSLNYQVHQSRYEYARGFLPSDGAVLDYGCGTGYGLYYLAQSTTNRCVGVDKAVSIDYATQRYPHPNLDYVVADLTQPEARFGLFDLIVSFDVIEHVDDIDAYLANIAAQLRNDESMALISTPWSYRHNNLFPAHNPFHHCELTTTEFFDRLDPFFTIDEILLTLGMLARVRRKQLSPNTFPAMCIELSGAHVAALEEGIEQLSWQVESLATYPELARAVSRRWRERKVGAPHALGSFAVGNQSYQLRLLTPGKPVEGAFVGQTANLAAIDLPLASLGVISSAELRLTILHHDQPLAQTTWPALLLDEQHPLRFHFPAIPASAGVDFRWRLETLAQDDDCGLGFWSDATDQPLWQEYYRRYRWDGPPRYSTTTEWIAPQLRPWLLDWPRLWAQADTATAVTPPSIQHPWRPNASPLTKASLALQHYGLRATIDEAWRYLRWRLRIHRV